jgi:hypothetical protein
VYASSLAFLPLPTAQVTNITLGPVLGGQVRMDVWRAEMKGHSVCWA